MDAPLEGHQHSQKARLWQSLDAICGSKGPRELPMKLLAPCTMPTPKLRTFSFSTELLQTILGNLQRFYDPPRGPCCLGQVSE